MAFSNPFDDPAGSVFTYCAMRRGNFKCQASWTMTNNKGTGNFTVEQAFVI